MPTDSETKQTKSKDLYEKTYTGKPYSEMSNDIRKREKKRYMHMGAVHSNKMM